MFFAYVIIVAIILGSITLIIFVPILKRSSSLPIWHDAKSPSVEKILVPAWRAHLVWLGALAIGTYLAFFSDALFNDFDESLVFVIMGALFAAIAIYALYVAIRVFLKRHCLVQLELTDSVMRYKPLKWYTLMRFGRINATPVFLSDDWEETPYTKIAGVSIRRSIYWGNRIYLSVYGRPEKPLLIITNNAEQLADILNRILYRLHLRNTAMQL